MCEVCQAMQTDITLAKNMLARQQATLVCVKNGQAVLCQERGIRPVMDLLARKEHPLQHAAVADKVVGRAAALLFAYGGVQEVYAHVMSQPAAEVFREQGIPFTYGDIVPHIINRAGDGVCPMEQRAMAITDPLQAYRVFQEIE